MKKILKMTPLAFQAEYLDACAHAYHELVLVGGANSSFASGIDANIFP